MVFSILMAFGIEAWWSHQGELRAEVEALQGLSDDFGESLERLASARTEHVGVRDASVRLLAMTGPDANPEDRVVEAVHLHRLVPNDDP